MHLGLLLFEKLLQGLLLLKVGLELLGVGLAVPFSVSVKTVGQRPFLPLLGCCWKEVVDSCCLVHLAGGFFFA